MRFFRLFVVLYLLCITNIGFAQRKIRGTDLDPTTLKNLRFTYQPYETAASNCSFEFEAETNDFLVTCDKHQFQVHFFARPHMQLKQKALEIFVMCHRQTLKKEATSYYSTNFWIFTSKASEFNNAMIGLGVDNDTASLDIRFDF